MRRCQVIFTTGLKEILRDGADSIYLDQDKKEWRVVVNTETNLLTPLCAGNLTEELQISQ